MYGSYLNALQHITTQFKGSMYTHIAHVSTHKNGLLKKPTTKNQQLWTQCLAKAGQNVTETVRGPIPATSAITPWRFQ